MRLMVEYIGIHAFLLIQRDVGRIGNEHVKSPGKLLKTKQIKLRKIDINFQLVGIASGKIQGVLTNVGGGNFGLRQVVFERQSNASAAGTGIVYLQMLYAAASFNEQIHKLLGFRSGNQHLRSKLNFQLHKPGVAHDVLNRFALFQSLYKARIFEQLTFQHALFGLQVQGEVRESVDVSSREAIQDQNLILAVLWRKLGVQKLPNVGQTVPSYFHGAASCTFLPCATYLAPVNPYMQRAIEIARFGEGFVAPNPLVGCVIEHEGKIIGEGWHRKFGHAHAEVNALQSVKNPSALPDSTLYVTLEPCSHFGKTPPCANAIVKSGIKKVVIATLDPNPKVSGQGVEILKQHGIAVETGVMAKEARWMNRRFLCFFESGRPYIILKWAESADRFMDPLREKAELGSIAISGLASRQDAHRLRHLSQAILVGKQTVLTDNPSLTSRLWPGNNPTRVVLDAQLQIPEDAAVFAPGADVIVFNRMRGDLKGHIRYVRFDEGRIPVNAILKKLHELNIQSLLVEGGRDTLNQFIDADLWDEVIVYRSPNLLKQGLEAPNLKSMPQAEIRSFEADRRLRFINPKFQ